MRTCDYTTDVLPQVLALASTDTSSATTADKAKIAAFVQRRGREAWQFHFWNETMVSEPRYFRNVYAAATVNAAPTATTATEVYFPATRKYYQALRATTGNAPATLSGSTWSTNSAYWAEVGEATGNDWTTGEALAVGDVRRNLDDGRYYQCHTAHTAGGTFDATKFGILTAWVPSIALDQTGKTAIGMLKGCFLDNPLTVRQPRRVAALLGPNGIHLPEIGYTSVYVHFQNVPPSDMTATNVLPLFLRDAIAHAAYSDFLRPTAKTAEVPLEETAGYGFLVDEVRKQAAMQRQAGKWAQN